MKTVILIIAFLFSAAYAQKMKYIVALCTIQQPGGVKDTAFNGSNGSITAFVDLDQKTVVFDWKMPDYNTKKSYTIVQSIVKKEEIYTTMGIYSIQLNCKNGKGKDCTIQIAISERINKIDIVVVDGNFVVSYSAIEVESK